MDLDDIWSFGVERWRVGQAEIYAAMIRHVVTGLVDFPFLGSPYPGNREGLRSIKTGQHRIVYVVSDQDIGVYRILHAGMDPECHLG
jgi:toxin ParE1/3/4